MNLIYTPEQKAHLVYTAIDDALNSPRLSSLPTFRMRALAFWTRAHTSGITVSNKNNDYLAQNGLSETDAFPQQLHLTLAGARDLYRLAKGANAALRKAGVDKPERGEVMARSKGILQLARYSEAAQTARRTLFIPKAVTALIDASTGGDHIYTTRFSYPTKAFEFNDDTNTLELSGMYTRDIMAVRQQARQNGDKIGCPAHEIGFRDEDGGQSTMLGAVWMKYVSVVYDGNLVPGVPAST